MTSPSARAPDRNGGAQDIPHSMLRARKRFFRARYRLPQTLDTGRVPPGELARMPDRSEVVHPPGSATAFETLLAEVVGSAFGVALRLTRNRADAEDLVQEAALLGFRGFASFEPGTNFRAWFFRILMNCFYAKYHRRRKHELATIDWDDTPDLFLYARSHEAGFPTTGADPAAQFFERLGTERVTEAIDRLPQEYRVVATLYFMEDFSYEEIARLLDCPVGTVRSRLHRGRKMLQKALWQVAEEAGIVWEAGTGGRE
jgi:RNA polymerase sigma-70 factor (ECF subfamily)